MRLLYICDALAAFGGLERELTEKANWLVEYGGDDVFLLTVNQGNHPVRFPLHPDICYDDLDIRFYQQYHLSLWKRPIINHKLHQLFRKRLTSIITKVVPDVIICTSIDYICDLIRIKGPVPLVFESHASRMASCFEGDGLLRRIHVWYLQLAVKKVDITVALTKGDADEWRKLTPNVCVIPNVVHLNESGSYSNCQSKSVIFVGRLCVQKDVYSLLHIWSIVHQRFPEWQLQLFGAYGEEQDTLLPLIREMNANIIVHEPTKEIFNCYLDSSIFLLTSLYEPFGLVLPEAMSCGLPVVAFDCPYGPKDIITDGRDGFLINNRDINAFAEKVCMLIENPELRKTMGQAGVQSSHRYDASYIMPMWKDLFKHLAT